MTRTRSLRTRPASRRLADSETIALLKQTKTRNKKAKTSNVICNSGLYYRDIKNYEEMKKYLLMAIEFAKPEIKKIVDHFASLVGLSQFVEHYPHQLSGGMRQRVSIARALIKNPKIILLDDCLSAVDTETEEAILNNLLDFCKDKTTIIVSHRVSSAKNADKIIIIDEGKIIQQGSHNQLVNEDGYYKALYWKQLSEKDFS
jgi:ABC-type multidrug transport system fused ATPase/permease subunit